jgi:hypothetical protein
MREPAAHASTGTSPRDIIAATVRVLKNWRENADSTVTNGHL